MMTNSIKIKGRPIHDLINDCVEWMTQNHYSFSRIESLKSLWRNGIVPHLKNMGTDIYNVDIGKQYITSIVSAGMGNRRFHEKIRSILILNEMLEDGMIYRSHKPKIESKLEGEIGVSIEGLLDKLRSKRLKEATIQQYKIRLQSFMVYLQQKSVEKLEQIQENDVIKYIETYKSDKSHLVTALKAYFDFIEKRYGFNSSIADSLRQLKIRRPESLPFVFNKEDIAAIECSVLRESPRGKRDYAKVLLASRLGLRISDIANLRFENIDWDKNVVSIVQEKTGHRVELPLLIEVGNAIVDYLKYGRPSIDSRHIFISANAPYRPVTKFGIGDAIRRIINASGVSSRNKRVGAHSLRFSLATTLIKEGSTLPMVSQILGHTNSDSTRTYIRVDVDSLRQCCLDVPGVPPYHYTSKKGLYYA